MNSKDYRKIARKKLTNEWVVSILTIIIYTLVLGIIPTKNNSLHQYPILKIINIVGTIIFWIVMPVLSRGLNEVFYRMRNGEKVNALDFLKFGFRSFKRYWGVTGNTILKMIGYIIAIAVLMFILVIMISVILLSHNLSIGITIDTITRALTIGGTGAFLMTLVITIALIILYVLIVIKNFSYALTTYIALDNPKLTTKEVVNKSEELMKGNKGKYFALIMSFIGWYILAIIVGAIAMPLLEIIKIDLIRNTISSLGIIAVMPYLKMSIIEFYEDIKTKSK